MGYRDQIKTPQGFSVPCSLSYKVLQTSVIFQIAVGVLCFARRFAAGVGIRGVRRAQDAFLTIRDSNPFLLAPKASVLPNELMMLFLLSAS